MKTVQFLITALCASFSVTLASPESIADRTVERRAFFQKRGSCSKTYKVNSGDTCSSIAQKYHISVNNLYDWNSSINRGSCNNLHIGQSYCVSQSSTKHTTTKKSTKSTKKTTKKASTKKTTTKKTSTQKSSGSSSSSQSFSGDGTYFNPGLGSCGVTNDDEDMIAALNAPQMGSYPNPNNNPNCGKYAMVHGPKGSVRVKNFYPAVTDTCPPCLKGSLDLSPAAFAKIADLAQGRVHITWTWD
ncbi:hypothetical protein NQZ79_g7294 [Umbelopsis isabellina]|nr:hypothetical protein NQZ79_g7294 [Umbelopsis isabellina]